MEFKIGLSRSLATDDDADRSAEDATVSAARLIRKMVDTRTPLRYPSGFGGTGGNFPVFLHSIAATDQINQENFVYPEYSFASNFLRIGEHRMHYIDEGEGPVVVLVHGNPTWSYYYRHLIRLLSPNHRVIAIDHIGCGLSDKPQDFGYYTLRQHIDNLEALMNELGIISYSLVVHDWGGAIGMGLATRFPERIERVVVLNTAAFRSRRIPFRIRICRWPLLGPLLVRGLNGFAWPATWMAVVRPMRKEIAAAYLAPYNSWKNRIAVAAFVRDIPLEPEHPSYGELEGIELGLRTLRDMAMPMLILWGGKDFCFDRVFYEEWLRRFPEAEHHYYPDGGHYLLEDKFSEIGPRIARFCAGRQ